MSSTNGWRGFIQGFDIFNKSVSFTVNGKDTHSTLCGGLTSISIVAITIAYLAVIVTEPLEYTTSSITNVTNNIDNSTAGFNFDEYDVEVVTELKANESLGITDIVFDDTPMALENLGFFFAAGFIHNKVDPNAIYLEFYTYNYNATTKKHSLDYLPFKKCDGAEFPTEIKNYLLEYPFFTSYMCPDFSDVSLISNIDSLVDMSVLYVSAIVCVNDGENVTSCEDLQTIADSFKYESLRIFALEYASSTSDPEVPVWVFMNTEYTVPVDVYSLNILNLDLHVNTYDNLAKDKYYYYYNLEQISISHYNIATTL